MVCSAASSGVPAPPVNTLTILHVVTATRGIPAVTHTFTSHGQPEPVSEYNPTAHRQGQQLPARDRRKLTSYLLNDGGASQLNQRSVESIESNIHARHIIFSSGSTPFSGSRYALPFVSQAVKTIAISALSPPCTSFGARVTDEPLQLLSNSFGN